MILENVFFLVIKNAGNTFAKILTKHRIVTTKCVKTKSYAREKSPHNLHFDESRFEPFRYSEVSDVCKVCGGRGWGGFLPILLIGRYVKNPHGFHVKFARDKKQKEIERG